MFPSFPKKDKKITWLQNIFWNINDNELKSSFMIYIFIGLQLQVK